MKQLIRSQIKGIPSEQVDQVLRIVEKNPELFQKIVEEIKAEVDSGKDQMIAGMEVMKRYELKLKELG